MTVFAERNLGYSEILIGAASIYDGEERLARELWRIQNGNSTHSEAIIREPNFGFVPETRSIIESGETDTYDVLVRRTQINGIDVAYKEKGDPSVPDRPYETTSIYGSDNGTPLSAVLESTNVINANGSLTPQESIQITYGTDVYRYTIGVNKNPCPREIEQKVASILGFKPRKSHWG